ncbi:MAG: TatD family deoxyribonuclease [Desulfovibrio sp.]|nr:TatD family deoxyribonuclease [Desulfovibrio sp.]
MSKKNTPPRPEPESLLLPPCGVDSHAHLDMDEFAADREVLLNRALASGVARIGNVFLGPEAYRKNRQLFAQRPEVFFLLGIHPGDADQYSPEAVEAMRQAFQNDPRLKAVGEIGLDFYWDRHPRDMQEQAFRAQLDLALALGLPPVVHCRDAFDDTLRVLLEKGWNGRKLLWHCFGGDEGQAQTILGHGWHVSIPGPVSYARNEALHRAVAAIPLTRMLLETDCPYLAAEPWRGKRNHPALLGFTAQAVARVKNLPVAEIWSATGQTACTFFSLEALQ